MQLKINDTIVEVPSDLSQITLGKFIQYWNDHGRELDKRYDAIFKRDYPDPFDQSVDLLEVEQDEVIAWYSFFTGFDFEIIRQQPSNELIANYRIIKDLINISEEGTYQLNKEIEWQGAVWTIRDWKITSGDFTFNELLTSKEVSRQIHQIGKGEWEALPYLCAIFFRKQGEPFLEKMVAADSDRLKLMHELPLSIALQVAFFLSVGINILANTFQSLKQADTVSPG